MSGAQAAAQDWRRTTSCGGQRDRDCPVHPTGPHWDSGWVRPEHLLAWLEGLLPENGMARATEIRAGTLLEEHTEMPGPTTPADVMWGIPGLEYPGAVECTS